MSERYEVVSDWRGIYVVDTSNDDIKAECVNPIWAGEIAAALNAASQERRNPEKKLLERAKMILKRCEGPVSDYVDDHSSEDFHGLTLRLLRDWQREYAALQTEVSDATQAK